MNHGLFLKLIIHFIRLAGSLPTSIESDERRIVGKEPLRWAPSLAAFVGNNLCETHIPEIERVCASLARETVQRFVSCGFLQVTSMSIHALVYMLDCLRALRLLLGPATVENLTQAWTWYTTFDAESHAPHDVNLLGVYIKLAIIKGY